MTSIAKTRPAETTSVAAALALLIAYAIGLDDPAALLALAVVIGFIPAGITWLVELKRGRAA